MNSSALPAITTATLPASYERAKDALASCVRIDECKDWADKAAALASYAKQADDPTLHDHALRIQSRAIRRAGQLLSEFKSVGGRPSKIPDGNDGSSSQQGAAREAGMSERQELTAVRVANVPAEEFEALVESDAPPTITALAQRGTATRLKPPAPPGFAEATHVLGILSELRRFCDEHPPEIVARAVMPHEQQNARANHAAVCAWLRKFIAELREGSC